MEAEERLIEVFERLIERLSDSPSTGRQRIDARVDRVARAIVAGERCATIADREGVSDRHVRRIKQRLQGIEPSPTKRGEKQADIAAALGYSYGTVNSLVRRGMPTSSIEAAASWNNQRLSTLFGLQAYKFKPTDVCAMPYRPLMPSDAGYSELAFSA